MLETSDSFNFIKKHLFDKCGLELTQLQKDKSSEEYFGCHFRLQGRFAQYRQGKVTPTKIGQFITLWKRPAPGQPIQPYDSSDNLDVLIVGVRLDSRFGQFIFPKDALIKQGVLSIKNKGGKRALRVYPPWSETESTQARKTQEWQLEFFVDTTNAKDIDPKKIRALYLQ